MKTITAAELDEKFDNGEDISEYLDLSRAWRGDGMTAVEIPMAILVQIDRQAERMGLTREALVQRWLEERLEEISPADKRDVAE